jgi:hypothetical protein
MDSSIAGFFAGCSQVLFGHPFDTIKILIQNNYKYNSLPFKDYYRGYKFPLVSATIVNSLTFPIVCKTYPHTKNYFISGCVGGVCISPIIFFFDIGKIKLQTKQQISLKTFIKNKGFFSTFCRESTAMSLYFGSYFNLKNKYGFNPLVSGGLAGLINWTITYPIDVIRNRQISQNCSLKEAFKQKKFWKGYTFCAIRSIIVNSAVFSTYEIVYSVLEKP